MVILRTRNKITDCLMILAWASPFNHILNDIVTVGCSLRVIIIRTAKLPEPDSKAPSAVPTIVPRLVVSTAAFHARVRGSVPGFESCVWRTAHVISIISPPSGGCPGPVQPICAQRWPKARFISFPPLSYHSSHHPQEVLLAQFSLYVHTFGLKLH